MNKFVAIGLGTAAVVLAVVVGSRLVGPPGSSGVGGPPSAAPSATPTSAPSAAASPSPSPDGFVPIGTFRWIRPDAGQKTAVTVTIPATGWSFAPDFKGLLKGDPSDPPEAAMLGTPYPAGTRFWVYGDPCHWKSSIPKVPATTVNEIVAALAAQATRDASAPSDVTVGGHAGKKITLHVPDDAPDRSQAFKDCDNGEFGMYGTGVDGTALDRYQQGPGQVDELWILDVDGQIEIIDAMYRPDTPAALIDEMRSIAGSATFE
jgi:hypothetical protein